MAMTTTYMTVNGKIRSEHRAGEAHSRDFVHDASGNVVGVYQNGWLCADAAYEPYGGIYTQWNMESGGYRFAWMGGWGYRQTLAEWSSEYVRARHYARSIGSWLSVDPLWPSEMPYGYVEGRVMTGMDYWGRYTITSAARPCPRGTKVIGVDSDDDVSIVVGSSKPGKPSGTQVNSSTVLNGKPHDEDCIVINGGLFDSGGSAYKEGRESPPIFDVKDCEGRRFPGNIPPPDRVRAVPIVVGKGYVNAFDRITDGMSPSSKVARTAVCVKNGKPTRFISIPNPPGATSTQLSECMKKQCGKGEIIAYLDGGGSTQVAERKRRGNPKPIVGKLNQRPVHNWFVICGEGHP